MAPTLSLPKLGPIIIILSSLILLGGYLKKISKAPTFAVLETVSLCTSVFQLAGAKKSILI